MNSEILIRDCIVLSSGTVSTISGYRDYQDIDYIQKKFVQFVIGVIASSPNEFNTWVEAWHKFEGVYLEKNTSFAEKYKNSKDIYPL